MLATPDSFFIRDRHPLLLFLGFLFLTVLLRFPVLYHYPLNIDEAYYSAGAAKLLQGGVYFKDVVDHKPPGIYLIYAGVYWLFGVYNQTAIHLTLFLAIAGTAMGIAELARALYDDRAALPAGTLYLLASIVGPANDFQAANAELFMNLPILWALALAANTRSCAAGNLRKAIFAGLLASFATLIKPQAGAVLPPLTLLLAWTGRDRFKAIAAFGVAFLFPILLVGLGIHAAGAWSDFVSAMRFANHYVGTLAFPVRAKNASLKYLLFIALNIGLFLPLLAWPPRRFPLSRFLRDKNTLFFAGWLGATVIAVGMGGRYYPHYFIQLIPPLALLAAKRFVDVLA
jgi:4-amino-4-deoxy-L-arabinose transferase-like glycosyltransferase